VRSLNHTLHKIQHRDQTLNHCPTINPLNDYEVFLINRFTDTHLLHDLIFRTQNTQYFTICIQCDLYTNRPALIQIELINFYKSTILLIETCHLPCNKQSLQFWLIQAIFKFILQSNKIIFCWGSGYKALEKFLIYRLYTQSAIYQSNIYDIQKEFQYWYIKNYSINSIEYNYYSLQQAIYRIYGEFLSKQETLNIWSQSLRQQNLPKIKSMIDHAVNHCLSVTKLAYKIDKLKFN
jgi:hypothetical protein